MKLQTLVSRLSISMRLTLWFGLSLLVLLSLFVVFIYTSVHVGLHDDLEERLREEAAAVRSHFQVHHGDQKSLPASSSHELQTTPGTYVRLLGVNGEVIRSSPAFQARPPLPVNLPAAPGSTIHSRQWGDTAAQSLYLSVDNEASPVAWMEVTKLQSPIHRQLHNLRWFLLLGIGLGVGVATLVGYGLARRALRPVASLTSAARRMQDRPRGTLPTDFGVDDELSELAATFNGLIERLRKSLERERRFRADAAHNMFTPLTAIQSEVDVTLRNPRSKPEYREALQTVQVHTETLSVLLDELMTLSRIEARYEQPDPAPINVGGHVYARIRRAQQTSTETASIELSRSEGIEAPVSHEDLSLIVDHLLENALKYTPKKGAVKVQVTKEEDNVVLRVSDSGIGFDGSTADRLFERFYRTAAAEQRADGGGLGLSIVRAVAESYGGTVTAWSPGEQEGSTFEVSFPACSATS